MDWNWNSELTKHSITADPEVLRVLYERLKQRKLIAVQESYYNDQTWRDQITIEDAQWLTSLGISPL